MNPERTWEPAARTRPPTGSLLPFDAVEKLPGGGRRRVEGERPFALRSRGRQVFRLHVGFAEHHVRLGRLGAPDRDLERVDRFARPPISQMDPAEQQVRLGW